MGIATLQTLLEQGTFYVTANTEDLTPGDDAAEVPNGGNSLNWILGHVVYWRNDMIELVGGKRVWSHGVGRQYRGDPGERRPKDFDPATAMALSELTDGFRECSRRLKSVVDAKRIDSETQTKLLALFGHEFYHAGQLGVLRRIAGRGGAI